MPVTVELIENQHAIQTTITEPWSLQDLFQAIQKAYMLREQTPHRLHAVLDVSGVRNIPSGVLRARSSGSFTHPNRGRLLVVGASVYAQGLLELMANLSHGENVTFFQTRESAIEHLHQLVTEDLARV